MAFSYINASKIEFEEDPEGFQYVIAKPWVHSVS